MNSAEEFVMKMKLKEWFSQFLDSPMYCAVGAFFMVLSCLLFPFVVDLLLKEVSIESSWGLPTGSMALAVVSTLLVVLQFFAVWFVVFSLLSFKRWIMADDSKLFAALESKQVLASISSGATLLAFLPAFFPSLFSTEKTLLVNIGINNAFLFIAIFLVQCGFFWALTYAILLGLRRLSIRLVNPPTSYYSMTLRQRFRLFVMSKLSHLRFW